MAILRLKDRYEKIGEKDFELKTESVLRFLFNSEND
jgi:hypothetical protein